MSRTYVTRQGDMWDSIAHAQLGDVSYADKLMNANVALLGYYIFPSGLELVLPDVVHPKATDAVPPWKRVKG